MRREIRVSDETMMAMDERISYEEWIRRLDNSDDERHRAMLCFIQDSVEHDLTPRQRLVYRCMIEDHMSGAELAEKLGVNASTIYRTRDRALEKIRKRLGVMHLLSYLF